jgi:hypothetical protein
MSNYSLIDALSLQRQAAVLASLGEVQKQFSHLDSSRHGSTPADPVRGAFQNEDGTWTSTFKAGMAVGSAPVSNRQRME